MNPVRNARVAAGEFPGRSLKNPSHRTGSMHSDRIAGSEIRRFEEQYAEAPESFVFARLADAHRKAGNSARALEILEQGLERHPAYLSAHIVYARCLMDLGRAGEAAAAWTRVLDLDQHNLVALRELAELALEANQREDALRWSERLLQIDPLSEDAERLAAAAADAGSRTSGTPSVGGSSQESAEASLPHDLCLITETMAALYLKQGLYEEAAEIYWELVKRRPAAPALRERLAEARALASGEDTNPAVLPLEAPEPEPMATPEPEATAEPTTAGPGIRSYLQALVRGTAPVVGPLPDDGDEPDRSPGSGFGEWLRRRGR